MSVGAEVERVGEVVNGPRRLRLLGGSYLWCSFEAFSFHVMHRRVAAAEARHEFNKPRSLRRHPFARHRNLLADAQRLEAMCRQHHCVAQCLCREQCLQNARRPHRVAKHALERIDRHIRESGAIDGDALHLVVVERGSAVGVDKGQFVVRRAFRHPFESLKTPLANARRSRDVVGIVAHTSCPQDPVVWKHLFCRLSFQHHRGSGLAQIQSVALRVVGTAAGGGEGFKRLKTRNDEARLLVATSHHRIAAMAL